MLGGDHKRTLKIFSEEADFSEKAFKLVLMSLLESGAEIAFITPEAEACNSLIVEELEEQDLSLSRRGL